MRDLIDIMVEMRDQVSLATDVYFPTTGSGPWPVLLERTPYGKRETNHGDNSLANPIALSKPDIAKAFAKNGFVYVIQDCRGRFASQGVFTKYVNEAFDGVDTMAWIQNQSWCNGHIGTQGLSYGAHAQAAAACFGPPGLEAMILDSGGFSNAFHSGIRQGGAFELKQLTWAYKHAQISEKALGRQANAALIAGEDIGDWMGVNPWTPTNSPIAVSSDYAAYVAQLWSHETFSDFWKRPGLYAAGYYDHFPDAAMVHISSWYDPYSVTAIENYRGLKCLASKPVKLLLGPWTHGQRSVSFAGDVDFGHRATFDQNVAPDFTTFRQQWFDHYLKGLEGDDYMPTPVKIFIMGGGTGQKTPQGRLDHGGHWRNETDWPIPNAKDTSYFISPAGRLSLTPNVCSASVSWVHDPGNPVPTVGGALASGAPLMEAGAFDQRETSDLFGAAMPGQALGDRDDVLTFETDILTADCEVVGDIRADLWMSSTALDTDVVIRLLDIYPPNSDYPLGYAMNLCHGILRLRFRDGFETAVLLEPGEIYKVSLQTFPTANIFQRGHKIRVEISSSSFPHFDVNPNTGAPAGRASIPVLATNTLHMGGATASSLHLPIVQRD